MRSGVDTALAVSTDSGGGAVETGRGNGDNKLRSVKAAGARHFSNSDVTNVGREAVGGVRKMDRQPSQVAVESDALIVSVPDAASICIKLTGGDMSDVEELGEADGSGVNARKQLQEGHIGAHKGHRRLQQAGAEDVSEHATSRNHRSLRILNQSGEKGVVQKRVARVSRSDRPARGLLQGSAQASCGAIHFRGAPGGQDAPLAVTNHQVR